MAAGAVHVVAGVLLDEHDRVLIAQRPPGRHLAGGWEFPGGKLEAGEAAEAGLVRELAEELGVRVHRAHPLICLRHRYPDREVLLDVWQVEDYSGRPRGLDGQALRWCSRGELARAELLPADRPVVTALRLPDLIEDHTSTGFRLLAEPASLPVHREIPHGVLCAGIDQAREAARAGADFIVFTSRWPAPVLRATVMELNLPVYACGVGCPEAWAAGATGSYRPRQPATQC